MGRRRAFRHKHVARVERLIPVPPRPRREDSIPTQEAKPVSVAEAFRNSLSLREELIRARPVPLPDREACEVVQGHRRYRRVHSQGDLECPLELGAATCQLDAAIRRSDRIVEEPIELASGRAELERALEIALAVDSPIAAVTLNNLAGLAIWEGDWLSRV